MNLTAFCCYVFLRVILCSYVWLLLCFFPPHIYQFEALYRPRGVRARGSVAYLQVTVISSLVYRSFSSILSVSIVANQTTGHIMYTGLMMQARKVICVGNDTAQGELQ